MRAVWVAIGETRTRDGVAKAAFTRRRGDVD